MSMSDRFKELSFVCYLVPEYVMPLRATERSEKHFEGKKDEHKFKLAKLALTTNGWTALINESYITATCQC